MHQMNDDQIAKIERLACIGETATEIMHEVSNQLTILLGYASILKESRRESWGSDCVDGLVRTCEACCRMSREISNYVHGIRAKRERRDLRRVIMKPMEATSHVFESAAIEVRICLPEERLDAEVNEFQLQQVVLNILHNARYELMKVKQRVLEIFGAKRQGRAVIEFRDSGRGIREEHRDKIFDPFFTTKPSGEGTGLGLSISRRIVEEHGGSLRAKQGTGCGATFVLDLPLAYELPEYCGSVMNYGSS